MILFLFGGLAVFVFAGMFLSNMTRKVFYTGCALALVVVGYGPVILFEPAGGWGLGGVAFIYYWIPLIVAFFVLFLIYEYRHRPGSNPQQIVQFDKFRKIIHVYAVIISCIFILYFIILIFFDGISLASIYSLGSLFVPTFILFALGYIALHKIAQQDQKFYMYFVVLSSGFVLFFLVFSPALFQAPLQFIERKKENKIQENITKSVSEGNYEECLQFTSEFSCAIEFAKKNEDPSYCMRLADESDNRNSPRYNCIFELAKQTQKESVCDAFKSEMNSRGQSISECKAFALAPTLEAMTRGMTSDQITEKAVADKNFTLCLAIPPSAKRIDSVRCQLSVIRAIPGATADMCKMVTNYHAEEDPGSVQCYKMFGINGIYKFPDGFTPNSPQNGYTVEKRLLELCVKDSECTLPEEYAIQSRCPFSIKCLQNQCTVVCPK